MRDHPENETAQSPDDACAAALLICEAMFAILIVTCGRCEGRGTIGLPTLRILCPECEGCGETTTDLESRCL